jgi:hypothetical protein
LPALFHIYGKDEHVGLIERSNRTIKEKVRVMTYATPYKKVPKNMIINLIEGDMAWIKAFPSTNGVSSKMSPAMIVQGVLKPNIKNKRIVYGSYALVYTGTSNNMKARSIPAIVLRASNQHGRHYFMSLYSGKRIHSYEWKELPVDDDVIERVEELAENEETPLMRNGYPVFTWKQRVLDDPELPVEDAGEDLYGLHNE